MKVGKVEPRFSLTDLTPDEFGAIKVALYYHYGLAAFTESQGGPTFTKAGHAVWRAMDKVERP